MEWWSTPMMMVMAVPILGAAVGAVFWSKPLPFKIWGLVVVTTTWMIVLTFSWMSAMPSPLSFFLMHLILAAGFVTTVAVSPNKETLISLGFMLLFTGLGLGFLASEGPTGSMVLAGIYGLLILAIVRHRRHDRGTPWHAIGVLTVGILSLLLSLGVSDPLRIVTVLIPLAIAWPLLPVQGAFVAAVSHLPGLLPAFLAVLLPSLGLHGVINLLPVIPGEVWNILGIAGLVSALYGSLLALSQMSMDKLLAYAHMALGAILWWYVSVTQSVQSGAVIYLGGLSLIICGLLLSGYSLRTRFGHLDLNRSQGLAYNMPRFSTLFVLFITAAIGLPLFALFTAFMDMMLGLSSTPVGGLMMVLLAWLMASWYFPRLMQQVVFGHPTPLIKGGSDLHGYELFPLIILLALLVMLGMAPSHWFGTVNHSVSTVQVSVETSRNGLWTR